MHSADDALWHIDESEFHELGSRREELEFLLRYAILAPSGHNTQPWMFRIVDEGIEVFADYSRRLPEIDPDDRELLMSVGAAITNLRAAAAHFGFESTVLYTRPSREGAPAALVALRETSDPDTSLASLFGAITRRRTSRSVFDGQPIEPGALSRICDVAEEHPEFIHLLLPRDRPFVAELVADADRRQMENVELRRELSEWVRPSNADATDGMHAEAFGIPEIFAPAAAAVVRRLNFGNLLARRDTALVESTPMIVVITSADDPVALLESGEILERLLLTTTAAGLQYAFINQPVQVAALRDRLSPVMRSPHPAQVLVRVGYGPAVEGTMPRREVAEVILPPAASVVRAAGRGATREVRRPSRSVTLL